MCVCVRENVRMCVCVWKSILVMAIVTVSNLAQGACWAVAVPQAFCEVDSSLSGDDSLCVCVSVVLSRVVYGALSGVVSGVAPGVANVVFMCVVTAF